jgi:ribosomal protein L35
MKEEADKRHKDLEKHILTKKSTKNMNELCGDECFDN